MLEVRNLIKIYKPKKGVPVTALNNISLKLPDKGMVFVLGKSGSGKSTLLNVLGGLDSYNSGEFIIKGEEAKGFKQMHFDSYRNTYIGFIFQEYNILKEFTVGANIALAIELQGRVPENDEINRILKEVDLEGFGDRKPNELSGGQLQRVAIARALVKNPDIIMADEPTGALDSKTGEAIFDTLKKLSKDKLVLIVSHDRDFSERYADRIIELSDGNIISDVTLVKDDSNEEENNEIENLSFSDDNISVKAGYELTTDDLALINDFLRKHNKRNIDINVATSKNTSFSKKYRFEETKEDEVKMDNSGFKLIKSKLSLKNSFKIGCSSLKYKKFKLVMTILLSFIAFTLFGLSDTIAAYNPVNTATQSIYDSNIDYAAFTKATLVDEYYRTDKLTKEDIAKLNNLYGFKINGAYCPVDGQNELSFYENIYYEKSEASDVLRRDFYPQGFSGFVEMTNENLNDFGYKILAGNSLPDGSKDEIAISKFVFESFLTNKYHDRSTDAGYEVNHDGDVDINNYSDIIGKKIKLGEKYYTVTCVIDTYLDESRYKTLLEPYDADLNMITIKNFALEYELRSLKNYSLHCACFVGNGFIEEFAKNDVRYVASVYNEGYNISDESNYFYAWIYQLADIKSYDYNIVWLDGEKTTLEDNEFVINYGIARNYLSGYRTSKTGEEITLADAYSLMEKVDRSYVVNGETFKVSDVVDKAYLDASSYIDLNAFVFEYGTVAENLRVLKDNYDTILASMVASNPTYATYSTNDIVKEYLKANSKRYTSILNLSDEAINNILDMTVVLFKDIYKDNKIFHNSYRYDSDTNETMEIKVVGITNDFLQYDQYMICNSKIFEEKTGFDPNAVYSFAIGKMPNDRSTIKQMLKDSFDLKADVKFELQNNVTEEMGYIDDILDVLGKVFLYVGIGFAVFASLLLSNFIAVSISYKKQEIGILRAIGSRSNDVFRIFFSEAFVIAMINYVLSIISTVVLTIVINSSLRDDTGLQISILTFGFRQIIVLFVLCVAIAAAASFLPVKKIASKKPIDAIRNR